MSSSSSGIHPMANQTKLVTESSAEKKEALSDEVTKCFKEMNKENETQTQSWGDWAKSMWQWVTGEEEKDSTDYSQNTPCNSPTSRKRKTALPRRTNRRKHLRGELFLKQQKAVEASTKTASARLPQAKKPAGMGFALPPGALDQSRLKSTSSSEKQ